MRNFKAIGLTQDIAGLENKGFVTSSDCGWTLLGYNLTAPPSFEDAFERAVALKGQNFRESLSAGFQDEARLYKTKVKLLANIQTRYEAWSLYLIGRSCLKLTAIAYL